MSATSVGTAWGDSIATGIVKQFKLECLRRGDVDINKKIGKKLQESDQKFPWLKNGESWKNERRDADAPGTTAWHLLLGTLMYRAVGTLPISNNIRSS